MGWYEIAPPQLDAIKTEALRGDVDQAFDNEHGLGPPGAAIGDGAGRVGHRGARLHMGGWHGIDARHQLRALVEGHKGGRVRAKV